MRMAGMRTRIVASGAAGLVVAGVMVAAGTASAAVTQYEAENATIFHGSVDSDHLGFSGIGFVNYINEVGSYVEFTVNADAAGTATLAFRYANASTVNRPMDIAVNGVLASDELAFPSTTNWDTWATQTITAAVNAGTNTIRATATTADGGPNLDRLSVDGPGGSDTQPPTTPGNPRVTGTTSSTISLAWDASTDNVGVTGYLVREGSTVVASQTGTTATITGLTPSTSHTYTITARDAAGLESGRSAPVTGTTQSGGTGYPQANSTGYPHGLAGDTRTPVTLTAYTGPCTITTPNTVIDSKDITCQIYIRASGVLIKNSRLRLSNTGGININDVYHAVIMDTEIDGQHLDNSAGGISLIGDGSYTCIRCDVHGSGDGARANWGGVAIIDSWIHDLYCLQPSCHNDGIQSTGWTDSCDGPAEGLGPVAGTSDVTTANYCIRIVHTRIENPNTQTSNILLKADLGPVHDVLVENNLFNGGGYTFYWYDSGFQISNGLVRNNRFRRAAGGGYWPNGGYYGPVASNVSSSSRYPVWTNNVWDDNSGQIPF
jgi:hypothetical protein